MPENLSSPPKPKSTRSESADKVALAQVEKWIAIIRELGREQAKT